MADSNFVVKNGLVANGTFTANSTQFGITSAVVANTTTIAIGTTTINAVSYTGTANNTSYVGSVPAANIVSNAQLSANLGNYQTTAGLAANVAKLTANNTSYVGSVPAANIVSNAQLSANLGNYQTTTGLAANVAKLTANNTSYVGSVTAANIVSNAQLSANLGNYQTTTGLAANVATLDANNSLYLGGTAAASYQLNSTLSANVAKLTANNTSYVGSVTAANVVSNAQLSANLGNYQTTAGLAAVVALLSANNASYLGGTAAASYQLNSTLSANVAKLTANNTSYVGSVTAANVVSNAQLSANLANYQTEAGLAANVALLDANNASYLGTVAAANYARLDAAGTFTANVSIGSTSAETDASFGVGVASPTSNRLSVRTDVGSPNKSWYNAQTTLTIANGSLTANRNYINEENLLINYSLGKNANGTQLSTMFHGNHQYMWNAGTDGGDAFAHTVAGFNSDVRNYANGATNSSINYAYGLYSTIKTFATGTIGVATGVFSAIHPATANATVTGNITTAKAFAADLGLASGNASIGTAYMYYGEYNASANVTTKWGVYTTGESKNYFSGSVGIGNTSPAHALSIVGDEYLTGSITFGTSGSISGTTYSGTANNVSYVGSVSAANVVSNAQLSANLSGYQTTAGLSTAVAALTANNANYLGGVAAASYQTEAGLAGNVALLSANNASYLGGVAAASYARTDTNEQFDANVTIAVSKRIVVGNTSAGYGAYTSNTTAGTLAVYDSGGNTAYMTPTIVFAPTAFIGTVMGDAPAGTEFSVQGNCYVTSYIYGGYLRSADFVQGSSNFYAGRARAADGNVGIYLTSVLGSNTQTSLIRGSGAAGTLTLRHGGNGTFSIITNATNATSGGTTAMTINYLQDVTIPAGDLAVTGAITATGNITAYYSDKRLKKDVKRVTEWRQIIDGLSAYWFKWNDTALDLMRKPDTGTQIGFLAQDVREVLPQAVAEQTATPADKTPKEGQYLTVMPDKIIPVLVAAVKDLTAEIDALKQQIAVLKGN